MGTEAAVIISALAMITSVAQLLFNVRRSAKGDVQKDSAQLTTVIVKLENIGNDVNEIKNDMRDVKADLKEHSERLVRAEQQIKVLNNTVFKKDE